MIVTPAYWIMSHEIAGTFALGFTGLMGGMIAGYLALTARTFDPRPRTAPTRTSSRVPARSGSSPRRACGPSGAR
nr:cytochrome c oxidase subunit 4 [Tessaracoccus coleopterorum]